MKKDATGSIAVESLDDVSTIGTDGAISLSQLKHTTVQDAEIGDFSHSLWRTLGNWTRLLTEGDVSILRTEFMLVTTAKLAAESGVSKLVADAAARDVDSALAALAEVAKTSKNAATEKDRTAFLGLSEDLRRELLSRLRVVPSSANLHGLKTEIEEHLVFACDPESMDAFRAELEGWWFATAAESFAAGKGPNLSFVELYGKIRYLKDKYSAYTLNIDVDDPEIGADSADDQTYIKQIRRVGVGDGRVKNAQRVFLKASAQRSKWLREAKIDPAELDKYDKELEDRWRTNAEAAADELAPDAPEEELGKSGRGLLTWAEGHEVPLKGASAQFLSSGSFHALADQVRIGWHRDWKKLFGKA